MPQAHCIVYDTATGDIKRHVTCPPELMQGQARPDKGEAVRLDTHRTKDEAKRLLIEQRVVMPAKGSHYLRKRAAAEIEARTPKQTTPPPSIDLARVVAAINARGGPPITEEDLLTKPAQIPRK